MNNVSFNGRYLIPSSNSQTLKALEKKEGTVEKIDIKDSKEPLYLTQCDIQAFKAVMNSQSFSDEFKEKFPSNYAKQAVTLYSEVQLNPEKCIIIKSPSEIKATKQL